VTNDEEKRKMFQMLANGLLQYLVPGLQQFGQQFVQGVVQQVSRSTPNQWGAPLIVERASDDDPRVLIRVQATPAQLLAEACDGLKEANESLDLILDHIEELRKTVPSKKRRRNS
jgi:hypothetical protein